MQSIRLFSILFLVPFLLIFPAHGESKRPNVLVVLIDALRADHLGCYGYTRETSPNIDALASESLLFVNAHAQSPWTKPSIPTLFTSLYPIQHGVYEGEAHGRMGALESDILDESLTTLAELFRGAGYRTIGFVNNAHLPASQGFAQGFDLYEQGDISAPEINRRFLSSLEARGDAPFFAYLHYLDAHWPFQPAEPYRSLFPGSLHEGLFNRETWRGLRDRVNDGTLPLSEEDIAQLVSLHDGAIAEIDHRIGELVGALRARGLLDRTVILLTSDHGEELLDHGQVGHGGTLHREVIEIPMMLRLPGKARAGAEHDPARLLDVLPTLLEVAGIEPPQGVEGASLLAKASGDREIVAETRHKRTYRVSIRRGHWKYIRKYGVVRGERPETDDAATSGLRSGMRIKVKGFFQTDGTLIAQKLSVKDAGDDDFEISGPIEYVDVPDGVFAIRGFRIDGRNLIDSGGESPVAKLSAGDWVKVEGKPEDGRKLAADKFEMLAEGEREVEVEGLIGETTLLSDEKVRLLIGELGVIVGSDTRIKGLATLEVPSVGTSPDDDPFSPERLRSGEGLTTKELLFNLALDPRELDNLAARESGHIDELRAELDSWLARMESPRGLRTRETLDDETIDRLRTLGYLD